MTTPTVSTSRTAIRRNKAYLPLYSDASRYKVLKGGAGSGKSYAITQAELYHLMSGKHRLLCLRKVHRTLRVSVFALFRQVLNEWGVPHEFNKVELSIRLGNGSEIVMQGLDDVEKLKSIAGISRVFIEEATEITEEDFNQVDLRLRGIDLEAPSITLAFNPINAEHWIARRFFDKPHANTLVLETTYKHNRFLDEQYIETLERLKDIDENYYRIYCLGEWGVPSKGIVFKQWSYGWEECDVRAFGLDFGFSADPSALIEIGIAGGSLYVRQHIYSTGLTVPDLIERMAPIVPRGVQIFADSAQPAMIEEIRRKGFNIVGAKKGKDSVREGIEAVKRFELFAHEDSHDLHKELRSYKWREDSSGALTAQPVDYLNHALDALRYAVAGKVHGKDKKLRTFGVS